MEQNIREGSADKFSFQELFWLSFSAIPIILLLGVRHSRLPGEIMGILFHPYDYETNLQTQALDLVLLAVLLLFSLVFSRVRPADSSKELASKTFVTFVIPWCLLPYLYSYLLDMALVLPANKSFIDTVDGLFGRLFAQAHMGLQTWLVLIGTVVVIWSQLVLLLSLIAGGRSLYCGVYFVTIALLLLL